GAATEAQADAAGGGASDPKVPGRSANGDGDIGSHRPLDAERRSVAVEVARPEPGVVGSRVELDGAEVGRGAAVAVAVDRAQRPALVVPASESGVDDRRAGQRRHRPGRAAVIAGGGQTRIAG